MNYWVIKGNPNSYDWDKNIYPGKTENWYNRYVPFEIAVGDRVFLWESGGKSRVIGLGIVIRSRWESNKEGPALRLKYLTHRLGYMPSINELRSRPILHPATFLWPGKIRTVYELSARQGIELYKVLVAGNPHQNLWPDLPDSNDLPDIDQFAYEGRPKLVAHLRRERKPKLVSDKKNQFLAIHGKFQCESCGSDHAEYGKLRETLPMVVEPLQPAQNLLMATSNEETNLPRTQKTVARDMSKNLQIAGGETKTEFV